MTWTRTTATAKARGFLERLNGFKSESSKTLPALTTLTFLTNHENRSSVHGSAVFE